MVKTKKKKSSAAALCFGTHLPCFANQEPWLDNHPHSAKVIAHRNILLVLRCLDGSKFSTKHKAGCNLECLILGKMDLQLCRLSLGSLKRVILRSSKHQFQSKAFVSQATLSHFQAETLGQSGGLLRLSASFLELSSKATAQCRTSALQVIADGDSNPEDVHFNPLCQKALEFLTFETNPSVSWHLAKVHGAKEESNKDAYEDQAHAIARKVMANRPFVQAPSWKKSLRSIAHGMSTCLPGQAACGRWPRNMAKCSLQRWTRMHSEWSSFVGHSRNRRPKSDTYYTRW